MHANYIIMCVTLFKNGDVRDIKAAYNKYA